MSKRNKKRSTSEDESEPRVERIDESEPKGERIDEIEPRVEHIPGRDFAGVSWAADEDEQTRDLRDRDPAGSSEVDLGGVSPFLENKHLPKDDAG